MRQARRVPSREEFTVDCWEQNRAVREACAAEGTRQMESDAR